MTSADTLQAHFKNEREVFLNMLDSIIILDIGTINYVDEKGRANVTSSTFINSKPITYTDAEIIYPGNANGCYMAECPGMACLIFLPKSCMPNASDKRLRVGTTSYNRDGVKVMPIGNGSNNSVDTLFSGGGDYSIIGQEYSIVFREDTMSFQRSDGTTDLTIDGEGQLYVSRRSGGGTYNVNIEDIGVTKTWLSQNKDVLWTDTLSPDGSRSFVQTNPNDSEADPLCSITIGANGTLTINTAQNVSVNANQVNLNGDSKSLVTYGELNNALSTFLQQLATSLSSTPITGNGSLQVWTDFPTSIDISGAEASTLKTGSSS